LQEEMVEVSAMITTQDKRYANGSLINVDDNAMLLVKTESGVTGSIIISWTNNGERESNYTYIYCQKGVMMLAADPKYGVMIRYADGQEELYKTGAMSTNEKQVRSGVSDMFIRSIQTNTQPAIDGNEGYKSLDVILAAFESNASGKTIKLKAR
jgi:predicted dehydrogenase